MGPTSDQQAAILRVLVEACEREGAEEIILRSEWLGYLPYGVYCWVVVGATSDVVAQFPGPLDSSDLDAMVAAGWLERVRHEVFSKDGMDTDTTYRLTRMGRDIARSR